MGARVLPVSGPPVKPAKGKDKSRPESDAPPPREFKIDDPFKYAPEDPNEDPFSVLLKPLIERDAARCAIWKDEVGNLLIFAGLFSAVVTAFLVESYKSVQQDPNEVLIGLLLHIANRLDGTFDNVTSAQPHFASPDSIVTSFVQRSSLVRINVFWFLSLILSLTTVLIGTISLQWLREHQSYSDLSPKQSFSVFQMRSEALEAWYVPQIFAMLPLLLQGSLVLFFAGMIDFSLLLGEQIAIPVCIAIGATLLFLILTTLLPTMQGFGMYLPRLSHRERLPTLCPYRSPQSHVFRTSWKYLHLLFAPVLHSLRNHLGQRFARIASFEEEHVIPYISEIWNKKTWAKFDVGWLFVRDACKQHIIFVDASRQNIVDGSEEIRTHRKYLWDQWRTSESTYFPLCDITQNLFEAVKGVPDYKHTESFLFAVYHSFGKVSPILDQPYDSKELQKSQYFYELLGFKSDLLNFFHRFESASMLRQEQAYKFLRDILKTCQSPVLVQHVIELRMRILYALFSDETLETNSSPRFILPDLFTDPIPLWYDEPRASHAVAITDILSKFFKFVGTNNIADRRTVHGHQAIPQWLSKIGRESVSAFINPHVLWTEDADGRKYSHTTDQYKALFKLIQDHLDKELKSRANLSSETNGRSGFFYLASFFARPFVVDRWAGPWSSTDWSTHNKELSRSFGDLCNVMKKYKDSTGADRGLERRFNRIDGGGHSVNRFSDDWWGFLGGIDSA